MRPNSTARALAYIQIAGYETAVADMDGYASLRNKLQGFNINQNRREDNVNVDLALNTAYALAFDHFMFNVSEKFRLGATYRSKIDIEAEDGTADFENIPNTPAAPFADTTFDATLPLPAEMTIGLSYEFCEKWLFAFDLNTTFWNEYESLDIDFADPNIPDSENLRNYKDASTYRFGLQYDATSAFTLRAGYYFDESPVQDGYFAPETPRNDSNGYTAGLTFNVSERLQIDASFLYVHFKEINASYDFYTENGTPAPFSGTYKSNAFVPGLGVTYKL